MGTRKITKMHSSGSGCGAHFLVLVLVVGKVHSQHSYYNFQSGYQGSDGYPTFNNYADSSSSSVFQPQQQPQVQPAAQQNFFRSFPAYQEAGPLNYNQPAPQFQPVQQQQSFIDSSQQVFQQQPGLSGASQQAQSGFESPQPFEGQRFIDSNPFQQQQQQQQFRPVQSEQQQFRPTQSQQQFHPEFQQGQQFQQSFETLQGTGGDTFERIQPQQQQQVLSQVRPFQQQPQQGFANAGIVPNQNASNNNRRPGDQQNRRPGSTRTRGTIDDDLQAQFQEIFNWNLDLANDTRFQNCTVPDIGDVSRACPKRAFYFGLNPQHRRAVGMVKSILTQPNNAQQTVCLAGAMRDLAGMNPNVWIRGMLGAHLSDVGLFDLRVPPMVEVMPHIFLTNDILRQAKVQGARGVDQRTCLRVDGSSGRDNGAENVLWYFREDVQVNSFHLNWHLIYPFTGVTRRADRSGELFYFTHRSHLARYHAERLSNGLRAIAPLDIDVNVRVPEGFNPHLDDTNSGMSWSPRRPGSVIQDTVFINITGVPPNISVADRVLHVQRVQEAIRDRAVKLPNGGTLPLDSFTGIDVIGHIVEASIFSPNGDYYGMFGFHNEGHVLLSLIENPRNLTSLPPGVMLEVATAMRDPVFYTYHTSMNDVFDLHKQTLQPYQPIGGDFPLEWDGIEITRLQVISDAQSGPNVINTFLNERTFELSRGFDFNRSGVAGSVPACVTHLDHVGFTYQIDVNRRQDVSTDRATVRIFMAPRFDEYGRRYSMREQRNWFFMLDLFTIILNRYGTNRIVRHSSESSLTIDIPQSQGADPTADLGQRQFCGCGWPRHMLIPKGTEQGLPFDLFVMITNGWEDYVAPTRTSTTQNECSPAPIYCGRLNDTYPDARPMGYPFDRLPASNIRNLDDYIRTAKNMAYTQVLVQHDPRPPTSMNANNQQRQPPSQQVGGDSGVTRDYYFNPNTQRYERPTPGVVPTRRTPVEFQEDRSPALNFPQIFGGTGAQSSAGSFSQTQQPQQQLPFQQQQPQQQFPSQQPIPVAGNSDSGVTRDYYFNPETENYERPIPGVDPTRRTPVQFREDRSNAFSFPQFFGGRGTFGQRQ